MFEKKIQWQNPAIIFICSLFLLAFCCEILSSSIKNGKLDKSKDIEIFRIKEEFGISNPFQILTFKIKKSYQGKKIHVVDQNKKIIPHQILSNGKLAIYTDLPANAEKTFKVVDGAAPEPFKGVSSKITNSYIELDNNITAIRVFKGANNSLTNAPAPIQGFKFQDDTWAGTYGNVLSIPASSIKTEFLENGPLIQKVRVSYEIERKPCKGNREKTAIEGGKGFYTCTIELQYGQPSIMIEEDTDSDLSYEINLKDDLQADLARYNGHQASSKQFGVDDQGKVYKNKNANKEAQLQLTYNPKQKWNRWGNSTYRFLVPWGCYGVDTGHYWLIYSSDTGQDRLLGIFSGKASRLIGPGSSGVGVNTKMIKNNKKLSLKVKLQRLEPTQFHNPHMRFEWGLFVGKKNMDLKPQNQVQGIQQQVNLHSIGLLNCIKDLPDIYPLENENVGEYLQNDVLDHFQNMLREQALKGDFSYINFLKNDVASRAYIDFWLNKEAGRDERAFQNIENYVSMIVENYSNGFGLYTQQVKGHHIGINFTSRLSQIKMLLASNLSPDVKVKLKKLASILGAIICNNNIIPFQPGAENYNRGTQNQNNLVKGARNDYRLFLAKHPLFQVNTNYLLEEIEETMNEVITDQGSSVASSHYTVASVSNLINAMQKYRLLEIKNYFSSDKMLKFGNFYLQLITPPDKRFNRMRLKSVMGGDGYPEPDPLYGQLATCYDGIDNELSEKLMQVWHESGRPQNAFNGPTMMRINYFLPHKTFYQGDANYPGYMSVLRDAYGSNDESVLWFINGEALHDHRHNDNGSFVLWALGDPISLNFGSIYYPRTEGALMHNMLIPYLLVKDQLNNDNIPFNKPAIPNDRSSWWHSKQKPFQTSKYFSSACTQFKGYKNKNLSWERRISMIKINKDRPIFIIQDKAEENDRPLTSVVNFNFLSKGPIQVDGKMIEPPIRKWYNSTNHKEKKQELPSFKTFMKLPGHGDTLAFKGQLDTDWNLILLSSTNIDVSAGQWGHDWFSSPARRLYQRSDYKKSNPNQVLEDNQQMMRFKINGDLTSIITPFKKGNTYSIKAVQKADKLQLTLDEYVITIGQTHFQAKSPECLIVATFGESMLSTDGFTLQGGTFEFEINTKTLKIHLPASNETRTLQIPEKFIASITTTTQQGVRIKDNTLSFAANPQVDRELIFNLQN